MSKFSLDQLKNAFAQKTSTEGNSQEWKKFFPFWKAPDDSQTTVRFLPDLDEDNPMGFLVENHTHELVVNGEKKKVACLAMYGESCPICDLSRRYYDEKNEEMGKKYYRKKSYIGQVLVIEAQFEYEAEPLVKLIDFGPKIFKQIQSAFQSGDLENPPFDLKGGYNFRIKKTKSGQWSDYGTSNFAPKQTDVSDDIIERLDLMVLADQRTRKTDRAQLEAMLLADQTGGAFKSNSSSDDDAPAQHSAPAPAASTTTSAPASTESAPAAAPAESGSSRTAAVLERLRARQAGAA